MNAYLLRVKKIIEEKNLSESAFGRMIGVKQSALNNMFVRNSVPKSNVMHKIHTTFGVNVKWLLTGEGEMFRAENSVENDGFRRAVPDVYSLYKENQELKRAAETSEGCRLCPKVSRMDRERSVKLEGYADALLMEQDQEGEAGRKVEAAGPSEVTYIRKESLDSEAHEPQPGYDADDEMLMPLMGRVAAGPSEVTYIKEELLDSEAHEPEPGYDADDEMLTPLMGRVAAGPPLDTERWPDEWRPVRLRRGEAPNTHYLLEVVGTSMTDAGIPNGSLILVRRAEVGEPGEVVVAYERDEGVTLKRLQEREGRLMLVWQDGSGRVRELSEETRIQGVFVRVVE